VVELVVLYRPLGQLNVCLRSLNFRWTGVRSHRLTRGDSVGGTSGLWGDPSRDFDQFKFLKGEIVARYRKTAIAALAASALLLAPAAAYAHDHNLNRRAREVAAPSSMSWAYYRGELTDLSPATRDVWDGARATAMMIGVNNESTFRVTVRGLPESADGNEYGAHLHIGPCGRDAAGAPTVGSHYNVSDKDPATGLPLVISDETEVWLDFDVSSDGNARAVATVPFVPDSGQRSITFHATHTTHEGTGVGTAGGKLACLPLDIHTIPNRD
jgi:hypothetical protein